MIYTNTTYTRQLWRKRQRQAMLFIAAYIGLGLLIGRLLFGNTL